jgi:hypothetical protein
MKTSIKSAIKSFNLTIILIKISMEKLLEIIK